MEIRCQANGCNTIVFRVEHGILILQATHHDRVHVSSFPLLDLLKAELGEDNYIALTTEMLKRVS